MTVFTENRNEMKKTINISEKIDFIRKEQNKKLDENTRGEHGQFMTPSGVANILASMFDNLDGSQHILDAGAGVGSLTAALVERAINDFNPKEINIGFWEFDSVMVDGLTETAKIINQSCSIYNI
ncbi:TPA: hypothetical protein ACPZRZ_004046, partial [Yersinia enterocolitica]